jgi:hypothetical protein
MTVRARYFHKYAPLHSDFAKDFVKRRFGEAATEKIYSLLPVYSKGPRKGLVKGWVAWIKCESGGWVNQGHYYDSPVGYVMYPGTHKVTITFDLNTYHGLEERKCQSSALTEDQWVEMVERGMINILKSARLWKEKS